MIIYLKKFGEVLTSRQAGKEAFAALQPLLKDTGTKEKIEVDFEGVVTFSPSWGDEFLTPLRAAYGERLVLRHTANPSVEITLQILQ